MSAPDHDVGSPAQEYKEIETMDENSVMSPSDAYDVCQVLKIVEQYGVGTTSEEENGVKISYDIKDCEDKNVVAIFGDQQSGKSTTINALRFGSLTKVVEGAFGTDISFVPPLGTNPKEVAPMGNGCVGCTPAPKPYSLKKVPPFMPDNFKPEIREGVIKVEEYREWVLLDTRGFLDERNPNEMVASALLTENALNNKAASVRLVFLVNIQRFLKGGVGLQEFGAMFGRLVKDDRIPVLFLFNNPPLVNGKKPPRNSILDGLRKKWNDIVKEQEQLLVESRLRIMQRLRNTVAKDDELLQKIFGKWNDSDLVKLMSGETRSKLSEEDIPLFDHLYETVTNDNEYMSNEANTKYLRVMGNAFKVKQGLFSVFGKKEDIPEASIGYIDPEDDESINEVRRQIRDLNELNGPANRFLDFSEYNQFVVRFRKNFFASIHRLLHLLQGQELLLKYPKKDTDEFYILLLNAIKEYEEALNDLEKNGANKATVARYEKQFGINFSQQDKEYENQIAAMDKQLLTLKNDRIALLEAHEEEEYLRIYKRGYHPVDDVEFNECPFERVKEVVLEEGTTVLETYYDAPGRTSAPFFRVKYENGSRARSFFRLVMSEVEARGHVILMIMPSKRPRNKKILEENQTESIALEEEIKKKKQDRIQLREDSKNGIVKSITNYCTTEKNKRPAIEDFEDFREKMEDILLNLSSRCGLKEEDPLPVKDIAKRMQSVSKLHYDALSLLYDENRQREEIIRLFKKKYVDVEEAIRARTAEDMPKNSEEAAEEKQEEADEQDKFPYFLFATEYKPELKLRVLKEFPVGKPAVKDDPNAVKQETLPGGQMKVVCDKNGRIFKINSVTYEQMPATAEEIAEWKRNHYEPPKPNTPEPRPLPVPQKPKIVCRKCGAALEPGDSFCGECCEPVVEEKKKICPKCGVEITKKCCTKCGYKPK